MNRSFSPRNTLLSLLALAVVAAAPRAHADEPPAPPSPESRAPAAPPPGEWTAPPPAYGAPVEVPAGYHLEHKRSKAPIIAGSITLGLGWAASVATGLLGSMYSEVQYDNGHAQPSTPWAMMFIPVAGPFLTLGMAPASQRTDGMTATLSIMGGAQVAGAAFLIAGLAMEPKTVLVPDKKRRFADLTVQPVVGPTTAGAMIGGAF